MKKNAEITCRIPRLRTREGRCFELAAQGCWQAKEWILIHGRCNGERGRIDHAWLQCGDMVYCAVLDQRMSSADFSRVYGAVGVVCYTSKSSALMASESGNYGPWIDLASEP